MAEVAAEFVAVVGEHAYAVRGGRRRRHREERVSATGKVTGDRGDLLREDVAVDVERVHEQEYAGQEVGRDVRHHDIDCGFATILYGTVLYREQHLPVKHVR